MVKVDKKQWKANYFTKLKGFMTEFSKVSERKRVSDLPRPSPLPLSQIVVVTVDNVGSNQMQMNRRNLRGKGELLMGKNTMIRKAFRDDMEAHPEYEEFLAHIKGNVGFIFTNDEPTVIRDRISAHKVNAPAKSGALSPISVTVPKGVTSLGPGDTAFFQALNIQTKITKGNIEIVNDVNLLKPGDKVGASEAALLNKLNISPFTYGMDIVQVFDNGSLYGPEVLNIKESDLIASFLSGVRNVAALSLAIGYPTVASVPHSIVNGYKNVLSVALATDVTFPLAEKAKAYLANPSAFAAAAPTNTTGPAPTNNAPAAAPAPAAEEEEEEEMGGFGLFD